MKGSLVLCRSACWPALAMSHPHACQPTLQPKKRGPRRTAKAAAAAKGPSHAGHAAHACAEVGGTCGTALNARLAAWQQHNLHCLQPFLFICCATVSCASATAASHSDINPLAVPYTLLTAHAAKGHAAAEKVAAATAAKAAAAEAAAAAAKASEQLRPG